jgi:hypothetical protein
MYSEILGATHQRHSSSELLKIDRAINPECVSVPRRRLLALLGRTLLAYPVLQSALLTTACGGGGSIAPPPPPPITDDQFLDQLEQAIFQFFWEQADPTTGQVKDRALAAGGDTRTVSSIAATGFGLTALCIAGKRGYRPSTEIQARVLATLNFLSQMQTQNQNQSQTQNGFFYHFIDMTTGQRVWQSEVSPIDTSILLCGVLTCRQYFQDPQVQSLASQIYQSVDWPWMLNGGSTFALAWTPENDFFTGRWDVYSELMMMYLLAAGSTTFPIPDPQTSWNAIARPTVSYAGLTYLSGSPTLFTHQYSHAWFDFRNKQDAYANYFNNSVEATQAHKQFCISLAAQFSDYASNLWGISASDSANGYVAWGGPPATGPIDGTVVPYAAGGSIPFASADCIQVLRHIRDTYPAAWQRYGLVDAFNPRTGWYDPDVIGIDLGITMLMAENFRSGFVWNTFMKNPEAQAAMTLVGFH